MPSTLQTRKPIDELQPEDLLAFPVWEFAIDEEDAEEENEEQDETWVRPLDVKSVPLNHYALSVAAEFKTASGQLIQGLIGMSTEDDIDMGHGVLLHDGKYLYIPSQQDQWNRENFLLALNLNESQVFPIQFSLTVLVEGESAFRQGELE